MYILNPDCLSPTHKYECGKLLGEYLMKHYEIPILSRKDDKYIFSNTEFLQKTLVGLPWYIKLFAK